MTATQRIIVKGFAVHIVPTDEGVIVDIFKAGQRADRPITSTYAFDSDLDDEEADDAA